MELGVATNFAGWNRRVERPFYSALPRKKRLEDSCDDFTGRTVPKHRLSVSHMLCICASSLASTGQVLAAVGMTKSQALHKAGRRRSCAMLPATGKFA